MARARHPDRYSLFRIQEAEPGLSERQVIFSRLVADAKRAGPGQLDRNSLADRADRNGADAPAPLLLDRTFPSRRSKQPRRLPSGRAGPAIRDGAPAEESNGGLRNLRLSAMGTVSRKPKNRSCISEMTVMPHPPPHSLTPTLFPEGEGLNSLLPLGEGLGMRASRVSGCIQRPDLG